MKILILTGKFGMGHVSAAKSLANQLQSNQCDTVVEDFLTFALPNFADMLYRSFNLLVTHGSHIFNAYYKLTALVGGENPLVLDGLLQDKLVELLEVHNPDVVVSTHPLCSQLMSNLKGQEGLDIPLVTCVTDITTHPEWVHSETDCYLVPSHQVARMLRNHGVHPSRILVTGIPVSEEYRKLSHRPMGQQKELLVMGGGLGLLPKHSGFYGALNDLEGVHTTVITGRNHQLYEKLVGRFPNVEVLGFTTNVSQYMEKADLIVTKPGGITLFETIFAGLPILCWPPTLQQERTNAQWLTSVGIGWVAEDMDCTQEIGRRIQDESGLSQARTAMAEIRSQLETERISQLMTAIGRRQEVCA